MSDPDYKKWQPGKFIQTLKAADKKFILYVLKSEGLTQEELESALLNSKEAQAILDNPLLLQEIMHFPDYLPISLEFYFYLLIRKSLKEYSIDNFELTEYLVNVLINGLTSRNAFNNSINEGKTFFYLSDTLLKIQQAQAVEQFYLRLALGNQALYLTGLFKDHLKHREERRGAPTLDMIQSIGKQQYEKATLHPLAKELQLYQSLLILSESFPDVRKALNKITDTKISLGEPFMGKPTD
jgi:hypothetical protein